MKLDVNRKKLAAGNIGSCNKPDSPQKTVVLLEAILIINVVQLMPLMIGLSTRLNVAISCCQTVNPQDTYSGRHCCQ